MSDVSEAIRQFENSPGWWDEAAWERVKAENARLREQAEALKAAILDIDAHSTAMGEDGDGFITGGYIVTVGSLHRALGAVGHTARKCSHEARCPTCEQAEALAAALARIAEGEQESYLSCPGVPICSRTHDDNCGVGIAVAALRAYREPWATVHTKYLDDQLVERCITCLERWPCKEDNHDDRR